MHYHHVHPLTNILNHVENSFMETEKFQSINFMTFFCISYAFFLSISIQFTKVRIMRRVKVQ